MKSKIGRNLFSVQTSNSVRYILNRGMFTMLFVGMILSIVVAMIFLYVNVPLIKILGVLANIPFLLIAWFFNRKGSIYGPIIFVAVVIYTVVVSIDPSTYTAPMGKPIIAPVLFAVPIAIASFFIKPYYGFITSIIQMLVLVLYMFLLQIESSSIVNFFIFGSINLLVITTVLFAGANIFAKSLTNTVIANNVLNELNKDLDKKIEERTADLIATNHALAQANDQLRAFSAQAADLAVEQERTRLACEIHDGLGQHLDALTLYLNIVEQSLDRPDQAHAALQVANTQAQGVRQEVRRAINALMADHAAVPLEALLSPDIHACVLGGIATEIEIRGTARPLPATIQHALYRMAQEALNNVRRHAFADHAQIILDYRSTSCVRLSVADDGQGFDTQRVAAGRGLLNLRERAALVGGTITIQATPGAGVTMTVEVPTCNSRFAS